MEPTTTQHEASSPSRVEALSDGVFAVALTLLTFDLVAAAKIDEGERLWPHLQQQWPTFLAYVIGFLTILVCWMNNRYVFTYITRVNGPMMWINGLQLALVAAVPLPTAILAEQITGDDVRAALIIYGVTFFLIALSFFILTSYVARHDLTHSSAEEPHIQALRINYGIAVIWTILCLVVASLSIYPALLMWTLMFVVFAFPRDFGRLTHGRLEHRMPPPDGAEHATGGVGAPQTAADGN